jgi:hypothetical protein
MSSTNQNKSIIYILIIIALCITLTFVITGKELEKVKEDIINQTVYDLAAYQTNVLGMYWLDENNTLMFSLLKDICVTYNT